MTTKEGGLRGSIRNVGVGVSAIPDSVTNRWKMDEGSGTTLNDDIGTEPATLNGATWESGASFTGGFRTNYDGADDYWVTDNQIGINGSQYSAITWVEFDQLTDGYRLFSTSDGSEGGWEVYFDSNNLSNNFGLGYLDSGGALSEVVSATISTGTQYMVAATGNGDSGTLYIYDGNGQVFSNSGTQTRGTGLRKLYGMARKGLPSFSFADGKVDTPAVSTTAELTQSEIEEYWEVTKR